MLIATISQWLSVFSNFVPISYKRNVKEHVLSKNGCARWGFKYCLIGGANCPYRIVKKDIDIIGVTYLAISISAVRSICLRTWCTRSNIAFTREFLTVVGLRFIPYDSHRYSECSLNSLPLSYMLYADYTPYSTRVFLARPTRSDAVCVRRPDHWGWISKETR